MRSAATRLPVTRGDALWGALAVLVALALGTAAAFGTPVLLAALCAGLALAVLVQHPWLGVAILAVAMLGEGLIDLRVRVAGIALTEGKLAGLMVLVSWFIHATLTRRTHVAVTPVTSGLVAVTVSMLLSAALGTVGANGWNDVMSVVLNTILISALYAMFEHMDLYRSLRVLAYVSLLVLGIAVFQASLSGERASAALGDANYWAAISILVAHVAIGVFSTDDNRLRADILVTATLVLYLLAVYQTRSRAGLLAATLVMPLTLRGLRWTRRTVSLGLTGLLIASPLLIDNVTATVERFYAALAPGAGEAPKEQIDARMIMLRFALETFAANPIHGVGIGRLQESAALLFPTDGGKDTHNSYAQIMGEQGLIGIATHAFLGWQLFRTLLEAWREVVGRDDTRLLWFMGTGILGFLLMQATSGRLVASPIAFFVLALTMAHARNIHQRARAVAAQPSPSSSASIP